MIFFKEIGMDVFQGLISLMGGDSNGTGGAVAATFTPLEAGDVLGGLSRLFSPAFLGGLAGALLSGKRGVGTMIMGALLGGSGAYFWEKLKTQISDANICNPGYAGPPAPPGEQASRLVRALVYAARSDGHIDEKEAAAIDERLRWTSLAGEGRELVRSAMREPINPWLVAKGVRDAEEALRLYTMSCAVIDVDQDAEKNYLDALAEALNIPDHVKEELEIRLKP